jgi:hypothetical protein
MAGMPKIEAQEWVVLERLTKRVEPTYWLRMEMVVARIKDAGRNAAASLKDAAINCLLGCGLL